MFLIPEPKKIEQTNRFLVCRDKNLPFQFYSEINCPEIDIIKTELQKKFDSEMASEPTKARLVLRIIIDAESDFLNSKNNEAYILESSVDEMCVRLIAKSIAGIRNAAMTLRQLVKINNNVIVIPEVKIYDYPDTGLRIASRWLLCAEACRWSYDWGQGREKTLLCYKNKIDFCMYNKINAVFFDGFSWNTDKYPEYAADMRMLNHYARLRGVKLIFGGHGIGVGGCGKDAMLSEAHDSPRGLGGDYNRESYPNGEKYPCSGNNPANLETRFNGTCRSNEELNKIKKQNLIDYVRAIEPGALYIHHEDQNLFYEEGQKVFWDLRCPECRKKWPDDRLEKLGGGASALAHGYDVFCEALKEVNNPGMNYEAIRDCTLLFCSPAYGSVDESNRIWNKTVELWTNISREMKYHENVFFGFREQFRRKDNGKLRIKEIAKSLKEKGKGHGIFLFAVGGADLYCNDALYSATPVLNKAFEGADAIFNFSGIVFQEPQELLNVEFCWNLNSKVCSEMIPSRDESLTLYRNFAYKRYIPAALPGFLENCCAYLYGTEASVFLKKFYLLGTENQEYPLCIMYYQFYLLKFFQRVKGEIPKKASDKPEKWKNIFIQTRRGIKLLEKAIEKTSSASEILENLEMLYKCLNVGEKFAQAVYQMLAEGKRQEINLILCKLEKYIADNFQLNFTSPGNSDIELWPLYIRKLREMINDDNRL